MNITHPWDCDRCVGSPLISQTFELERSGHPM